MVAMRRGTAVPIPVGRRSSANHSNRAAEGPAVSRDATGKHVGIRHAERSGPSGPPRGAGRSPGRSTRIVDELRRSSRWSVRVSRWGRRPETSLEGDGAFRCIFAFDERPLTDRVDRRNMESGPRLLEGQPRLCALLRGAVRRALSVTFRGTRSSEASIHDSHRTCCIGPLRGAARGGSS